MPAATGQPSGVVASLLWPDGRTGPGPEVRPLTEAAARDLQLAPLFEALCRDAPWLAPWFATPCADVETVVYRQQVATGLEREEVATPLKSFARRIQRVRQREEAAQRVPYPYVAESWFLTNAQR